MNNIKKVSKKLNLEETDGLILLQSSQLKKFRLELLKEQNSECPLCNKRITEIDAACDHDHDSGLIRGVLHKTCNSYEGVIKSRFVRSGVHRKTDLITYLENLIIYLKKDHGNVMHPSTKEKPKKLKKSSYNYLKKRYKEKYKNKKVKRFPDYPKSKKLTKSLDKIYFDLFIEPEYYGDK